MNLFDRRAKAAPIQQIQVIKGWVRSLCQLDDEVPISVSELRCHEPGCAPVETVIAIMGTPPKSYKIHAAITAVTYDDLQAVVQS